MDGWRPGIGDPTFLGWFTVAAYGIAALLAFRGYRRAAPAEPLTRLGILTARVQRRFWFATTWVLIALGINKQLDLQDLLLHIGRTLARNEGWYESRRAIQYVFIVVVAAAGGVLVAASLWAFRRAGVWVYLAQLGLIALCSFVVIRAASFHHVDVLLGTQVGIFKLNHILELGGIAIIALAAMGSASRS